MRDLIDRQAAIAAVIEAMVDSVEIMHATEALEDLPSAWQIYDVCPPEENGGYIVTDSTGEVFPAEYDAEGEEPGTLVGRGRRMHWTDMDTGVGLFDEEVTAWMELPDPFEG